jgi:hypothetical protein
MGFARWVFETKDLFALDPADLLLTGAPEARAMASADRSRLAIYSPSPTDLSVDLDLAGFAVTAIDLASRSIMQPVVRPGWPSVIEQPPTNSDLLILASRH